MSVLQERRLFIEAYNQKGILFLDHGWYYIKQTRLSFANHNSNLNCQSNVRKWDKNVIIWDNLG